MELIGTGREADVYALDDSRVLRRYGNGGDVVAEANVMRYVERHGFPVPQVFDAEGTDIVMARIDGPILLEAIVAGGLEPVAAGEMLASLQRRLHAVPVRTGLNTGDRILHLDLHPHNVMLSASGPVVIDWQNAA